MGILAVILGDDIVEVLLRTKTIPFDHFHNRGNLPHYIGDGRFFDRHAVAFGAAVTYGKLSVESCTCLLT
jgi:hypothetical protein